jgi:hypothetical protein
MEQPNNDPYLQSFSPPNYEGLPTSPENIPLPDSDLCFDEPLSQEQPAASKSTHEHCLWTLSTDAPSTATATGGKMALQSSDVSPQSSTHPAPVDDKAAAEMELFSRLTLNDSNIAPKPFEGNDADSEQTERWLAGFRTYAKLRSLSPVSQTQYFALLMVKDAGLWLQSLSPDVTNNIDLLMTEFLKRFSLSALEKWRKSSSLWTRQQGPDESVDKFVSHMKNLARVIPITDPALLQFAITRGFRPDIKRHVLQSQPTTMDEVLSSARVSEIACAATSSGDEVGMLRKQIATLIDKLDTQVSRPTIAVVDDSARHVTFSPSRQMNTERYSPSSTRRQDSSTDRRPTTNFVQRPTSSPRLGQRGQSTSFYSGPRNFNRQPNTDYYDQGRQQSYVGTSNDPRYSNRSSWQPSNYRQQGSYQYSSRPFGQSSFNNSSRFASVRCYCCNRFGHIAASCPQNCSQPNRA